MSNGKHTTQWSHLSKEFTMVKICKRLLLILNAIERFNLKSWKIQDSCHLLNGKLKKKLAANDRDRLIIDDFYTMKKKLVQLMRWSNFFFLLLLLYTSTANMSSSYSRSLSGSPVQVLNVQWTPKGKIVWHQQIFFAV